MNVLFVQGPKKTATSSLTGLLNCHPEIFVLFETYMAQSQLTKYGNQLLEKYPDARQFFRSEKDFGKPILEFFEYLKEKEPNFSYQYVGTKINSMDASLTQEVQNHKIIYTKRDIRSWLVKESVIKYFRTDLDIVAPAIDYLKYIIRSAQSDHAFHFWLEDFISDQKKIINRLSDYLDLDMSGYTENWWEKFGNYDANDPKSIFKLEHVHHSSKVEPTELDTDFKLKDSLFWTDVNNIFDRYYLKNDYSSFSMAETEQDLDEVDKLKKYAPLPFSKAYLNVDSIRIGFSTPREIHFQTGNQKDSSMSVLSRLYKSVKRRIK